MNPEPPSPHRDGSSNAKTPLSESDVTPEQMLSFALGLLEGAERARVQALILDDADLFDEMQDLRRRVYAKERPLALDAFVALAESESQPSGDQAPDPAQKRSSDEVWTEFRSWCADKSAEVVAMFEMAGSTLRSLQETGWIPAPAGSSTLRLSTTRGVETKASTVLSLQKDGCLLQAVVEGERILVSLQLQPAHSAAVRVYCPDPRPGGVEWIRHKEVPVATLGDGCGSIRIPCSPGTNRLLLEIRSEGNPDRYLAFVVQRTS
jgi:hypothetical protein